jgi:hypothetical protein
MLNLQFSREHLLPEHKKMAASQMTVEHFSPAIQELISHASQVDSDAEILFIEQNVSTRGTGTYTRLLGTPKKYVESQAKNIALGLSVVVHIISLIIIILLTTLLP